MTLTKQWEWIGGGRNPDESRAAGNRHPKGLEKIWKEWRSQARCRRSISFHKELVIVTVSGGSKVNLSATSTTRQFGAARLRHAGSAAWFRYVLGHRAAAKSVTKRSTVRKLSEGMNNWTVWQPIPRGIGCQTVLPIQTGQ